MSESDSDTRILLASAIDNPNENEQKWWELYRLFQGSCQLKRALSKILQVCRKESVVFSAIGLQSKMQIFWAGTMAALIPKSIASHTMAEEAQNRSFELRPYKYIEIGVLYTEYVEEYQK